MPAKCYHFVTVLSFFCYFLRFSCPRMLALDLIGGLKRGSSLSPRKQGAKNKNV